MVLIEQHFPIEKLNPVALGEGNSKKPVYRMHKWWARRLSSVFRMIILSAFSQEDDTESNIWNKFCNGADLKGKIVLDPFMGGGTIIVEALRLGCKTIGLDINPVAWFVTKKEIEPVNLNLLDAAFHNLEQAVGKRIKDYYHTTCLHGHDSEVMYYFWVKVAQCAECNAKINLFPNYELSRRDHVNICICPNCLQVIETLGYNPNTKCNDCRKVFDPRTGVSGHGIFRCLECGKEQKLLDAVQRKSTALDMELHALEGYCKDCGRFFKRIDDNDLKQWGQAKEEFTKLQGRLLLPHQTIPTQGRSGPRPVNHGYTYFWQMFNERQLVCLSILLEHILKISDQNIRELMLAAFSDSLNTNNMFCKYEIEWHKISLFFSLHAFHPIERPAENNVWGTVFGRGTFVKCFEKVRKAKKFCQNPCERLLDSRGQRYSKQTGEERLEGRLVNAFEELKGIDNAALLHCQSSEDLSFIPDKSVDAVITDPPYFDNVQYSELADFFYVWLRLALKDAYSWFQPELSGHPDEIVKNDKLGKTTYFFNKRLQQVFLECHRVIKDNGLLVFTFHHNKIWAWQGIGQLLIDAGFYISATPVVRSEGRGEVHSSEGNIRYDCILVCRKRYDSLINEDWPLLKKLIFDDAILWAQRTLKSEMPINEVDVSTIVMGKTLEFYTKAFANRGYRDETPTLLGALEEMANLVSRIGLKTGMECQNLSKIYANRVEQLALFVMESKLKYGTKMQKKGNSEIILYQ